MKFGTSNVKRDSEKGEIFFENDADARCMCVFDAVGKIIPTSTDTVVNVVRFDFIFITHVDQSTSFAVQCTILMKYKALKWNQNHINTHTHIATSIKSKT